MISEEMLNAEGIKKRAAHVVCATAQAFPEGFRRRPVCVTCIEHNQHRAHARPWIRV
jgi:hypothetical protein